MKPEIVNYVLIPESIDQELSRDLPLQSLTVQYEFKNIIPTILNLFRATLLDEITGYCLTVPSPSNCIKITETDDYEKIAISTNVASIISSIRLRPFIPKDIVKNIEFQINYANKTDDVQMVYAKDILTVKGSTKMTLFNPYWEISHVQRGFLLCIEDIKITKGVGKNDAKFSPISACGVRYLDIERYSFEEQCMLSSKLADMSCYKENFAVKTATHGVLQFDIEATHPDDYDHIYTIPQQACVNIISRLRSILNNLNDLARKSNRGYVIEIEGETEPMGAFLSFYILTNNKDFEIRSHKKIHETLLRIYIASQGDNALQIFSKYLEEAIIMWEGIEEQVKQKKYTLRDEDEYVKDH